MVAKFFLIIHSRVKLNLSRCVSKITIWRVLFTPPRPRPRPRPHANTITVKNLGFYSLFVYLETEGIEWIIVIV